MKEIKLRYDRYPGIEAEWRPYGRGFYLVSRQVEGDSQIEYCAPRAGHDSLSPDEMGMRTYGAAPGKFSLAGECLPLPVSISIDGDEADIEECSCRVFELEKRPRYSYGSIVGFKWGRP